MVSSTMKSAGLQMASQRNPSDHSMLSYLMWSEKTMTKMNTKKSKAEVDLILYILMDQV